MAKKSAKTAVLSKASAAKKQAPKKAAAKARPAPTARQAKKKKTKKTKKTKTAAPVPSAKQAKAKKASKRAIEQYGHGDAKRVNNPPVGLVNANTEAVEQPKKTYAYDPHLDPQLVWAGKAERTSFEIPTVSLHVHERIDPKRIIAAVRTNGERAKPGAPPKQLSLFEQPAENPPLRDALDFYKHPHGWSNRLIAGDSLLVMNSMLEKEGLAGKVQMIYLDPPYGIRYGSNFQPFVNKRDVKDGADHDLTQEPETLKAFRDTWELGIHSYLTYLRDRLLLAKDLLHESGSIFVQISDENLHHVRELMDEVFGTSSFVSIISFRTTSGFATSALSRAGDYLCWYGRNPELLKYRALYRKKEFGGTGTDYYSHVELGDGSVRNVSKAERTGSAEIPSDARLLSKGSMASSGAAGDSQVFEHEGREFTPGANAHWKAKYPDGVQKLAHARRVLVSGNTLKFRRYFSDFEYFPFDNFWSDQNSEQYKSYAVQTSFEIVKRCLLMTTDPGDLVFDPTCGSGTTAYVAEQWGRRWITCDTSRVAVALAKQRLMTGVFDYYQLAQSDEGIRSGFRYKTVPHVTLKSIANNPEIREGMTRQEIDAAIARYADQETLYDQPLIDRSKARVAGPFTVEAVPAINVRPVETVTEARPMALDAQPSLPGMPRPDGQERFEFTADVSVSRSGETVRQVEWRDELAKTGVRGKAGQTLDFARLEPLPAARHLHAIGETNESRPKTVVVSFGPEFAPLEQTQVERAWREAQSLSPKPDLLLFAAFMFDPEAQKDIDELDPQKAGMTLLRVQMNADLLTADLKKKRASNESFWLMGQPDVELSRVKGDDGKPLWQVAVRGFDYYDPKSGAIQSGDTSKIAMWMLDTDYDDRSLLPRQVFFPMAGDNEGWARLAKNLKAEIDEDLIEAYRGTESLPFDKGKNEKVAVKIIDDRGIESLRVLTLE